MNRSRGAAWLALALGLASFAGSAKAAITKYNLNVTGTDFSFTSLLEATSNGDGSYTAVSGSGQFGNSGLFANIALTLTPNPNAPNPSSISLWTTGWFFDNLLFPDAALIGINGVSFSFTDSGKDYYIAPWLNSTEPNTYVTQVVPLEDGPTGSSQLFRSSGENSTVTLTSAVPEASTSLGLLALGAGGLFTRRRLQRKA